MSTADDYKKEITFRIVLMSLMLEKTINNDENDNLIAHLNEKLTPLDATTIKVSGLAAGIHDDRNLFWGSIENKKKFSDIKNIKNIFDPDSRNFRYVDESVIDVANTLITELYYSESPSTGSILNLNDRNPIPERVEFIKNHNLLKEKFYMKDNNEYNNEYIFPIFDWGIHIKLFYMLLPLMLHSLQFHLRIKNNGKKNILNPDIINSDIDALCTTFFGNHPEISQSVAAFLKLGYLKFYYYIGNNLILFNILKDSSDTKKNQNKANESYIILSKIADKLENCLYDQEDDLKSDCLDFWYDDELLQWKMFVDPFDIYENCMDTYVDLYDTDNQSLKMVSKIVAPRIATILVGLPENPFDFNDKETIKALFSEIEDKTVTKPNQIFKVYRAWIIAFYYYLQEIKGNSKKFRSDHQECFENIVSPQTPDGPDTPDKVEGPTPTIRKTSRPDTLTYSDEPQATLDYVRGILNNLISKSSRVPDCLADYLVQSNHYGSPSVRKSGSRSSGFNRQNRQGFTSDDWCIVWKNQNYKKEIALHYYDLHLLEKYENKNVPPPHWTIILKDFDSAVGSSKIKIEKLHTTSYDNVSNVLRLQNDVVELTNDSPLHHLSKLTELEIEQTYGENEFFLIVPKGFTSNMFNSLRNGGSVSSGCMVLATAFVTLTSAIAGAFSYSGGG